MPASRKEIEEIVASKDTQTVVITGVGLMTSVGHRVPQAVTSMRAGITRMGEFPAYEPILREPGMVEPEPLIASAVVGVTDELTGVERLLALGVPALKEA